MKKAAKSNWLLFFLVLYPALILGQTVYIVNSTADLEDTDLADRNCEDINGNCTLRAAIQNANKSSKTDSVHFNIPGKGPFYILLEKYLPAIKETIFLDATTQTGYTSNSLQIILDGKRLSYVRSPGSIKFTPAGFFLTGNSAGSLIRGFVIGGFGNSDSEEKKVSYGYGVFIDTNDNIIQGNYIGLSADGKTAFRNIWGIMLYGSGNIIGGNKPEERNIISGNLASGIHALSENEIRGNYIGTTQDGNYPLGNRAGISLVRFAEKNQITQNLISGNKHGIQIAGDENYILDNKIGTNSSGTKELPNEIGIGISGGHENIIAGKNIISGNKYGIYIDPGPNAYTFNNQIAGNYIGTDINGGFAIPNETGIYIRRGDDNTIGGRAPVKSNLISGNSVSGIELHESNRNRIEGNYIGTDATGKTTIPNGAGIIFSGIPGGNVSKNNMIIKNTISGNRNNGVEMNYCSGNSLSGNYIGTAGDGITAIPNCKSGLKITVKENNNCIGGPEAEDGNVIAYNQQHGLEIIVPESSAKKIKPQILNNKIFGNGRRDISVNGKEIDPKLYKYFIVPFYPPDYIED